MALTIVEKRILLVMRLMVSSLEQKNAMMSGFPDLLDVALLDRAEHDHG
jgi:hypothetical protein